MRAPFLVLGILGASLLAFGSGGQAQRTADPTGPFQRGMVLGIFSKSDPEYFRHSLAEMQELGVDSVSFIVPRVQKDIRSIGFREDKWVTPGKPALRTAIREAHRLGMRVFLLPIVYLDDLKEGEWRGTIRPGDWDAWFAAYQRMILEYATLAAEEKVEYFSVGSELCSTEKMEKRWARVIGAVRRVYPGKLTYSANWDHLDPVSFGKHLDFLGMNAYYEVGKGSGSDVQEMSRRWTEIQKGIRAWKTLNGDKPLVITEIGYPSRKGAGVDPWNYMAEGDPDPEEQRKCFQAFVEAWKSETMLAGVYVYLWWGEGGPTDRDYTPRGKPAQEVIRSWYFEKKVEGGPGGLPGARQ